MPHEPVQLRHCLDCHQYDSPADHTFTLLAEGEALCAKCHERHESVNVHKPVLDGRCTDCHDPHGSSHGSMLYDETERMCLRCHTQDFSARKFVHGPVVVGACVVCHSAHSSPQPGLLVAPIGDLCVECHDSVKPPENRVGITVHAPMAGGCTSCHDPHATDYQFQLSSGVQDLCFGCHKEMRTTIMEARIHHSPVDEGAACTNCHNPHFSSLPRLQKQAQPDLCLGCHDEPLRAGDGTTLTNMEELLRDNPDHHGPIREGACTACHNPHSSDRFRLLYMEYPPEFYAPFKVDRYRLCFSCHLEDLVEDRSGAGLTGFRNGDENLHYVHVNRQKGRTCRACHEVHASKHEFHIRDKVPFGRGGWELPINYEKSVDGGRCSPGCHKPRTYSRTETPTLSTPAASAAQEDH
ncbi:MAG: cytochrome c3 family protein [Phycisphaeraceae bacterium]|nr:MAG: cytochrome c3 family protein [Phycisphaeraceae bacterium]